MSELIKTQNLAEHDQFYADLLVAHEGLSDSQSHVLNAQLVLIMANHIGDLEVLRQALDLARQGIDAPNAK